MSNIGQGNGNYQVLRWLNDSPGPGYSWGPNEVPNKSQSLQWNGSNIIWQDSINTYTYSFLAGSQITNVVVDTPKLIGSIYFDPNNIIPSTSNKTKSVIFKTLIQTSKAANTVNIQLYDKNGITGSVGLITSSLVGSKTDIVSTYYQIDLTSVFGTITNVGIIECWLWMGAASASEYITCNMAKLDITWI